MKLKEPKIAKPLSEAQRTWKCPPELVSAVWSQRRGRGWS
jgi:hypothetical protein